MPNEPPLVEVVNISGGRGEDALGCDANEAADGDRTISSASYPIGEGCGSVSSLYVLFSDFDEQSIDVPLRYRRRALHPSLRRLRRLPGLRELQCLD